MEVFEFLVMEAHVVGHIGAGMYLYASQDNSQIYLEAHEAEGAADEGEHHDGDDLLGRQVRPRDHLVSVEKQGENHHKWKRSKR